MYGSLITTFKELDTESKQALSRATCGTCYAIRKNLGPEYIGVPFGDAIGINIVGRALGILESKSNDYSSAVHGLGIYIKSQDTWRDNDSLTRSVLKKRCEKLPGKVDKIFYDLQVPIRTEQVETQFLEGMKLEEGVTKGIPYALDSILEKTTNPITVSFEGLAYISNKSAIHLRRLGHSTGVILSVHDAKQDLKNDNGKFNLIQLFKKSEISKVYDSAVGIVDELSFELFDKEPYDGLVRKIFDKVKKESEPSRTAKYKINKALTSKPALVAFMALPFAFRLVNVAMAQEPDNGNGCNDEEAVCCAGTGAACCLCASG